MNIIERVEQKERQYVEEVLSMNFRSSAGYKMTKRPEEAFAEKFDSKYAVAFCNGTATLHIALEAAGVGMGDEVIVPPLTMSSTTFGVLHANATPVFADVDPDTFVISAESVEKCITPKTKAIIAVSLYGLSPDFDALNAIAKKLLRETDLSVSEIGEKIGYITARGFFSAFQKYEGCTPGEYRKKAKNM